MTTKKLKRIAFVSDAIYPFSKGGKEKRLYDITQQLVERGYQVDIYTMKWWDGEDIINYEGLRLHALCQNYHMYTGKHRSIRQGVLFGLACTKLISKKFDVVDVDQIPFFPLYTVWIVCLLRQRKMYATWHEVWGKRYWQKYLKIGGSFAAMLEKIAAKLPTHIIAVSEYTADQLNEILKRKRDVAIVSNTVNFKSITRVKPSGTHQDVIFAARLLEHKGADLLIKAIKHLKDKRPDISCLIIGTGPEEVYLKQLVDTLHLEKNIHFHDFYEDINNLYALIKSSKVYVLPSQREGFGLGLLEANVCGIPAVTLDTPHNAARLMIKESINGSVVKPTTLGLSKAIAYWIDHTASDTRSIVSLYDSRQTVTKLLEVYSL